MKVSLSQLNDCHLRRGGICEYMVKYMNLPIRGGPAVCNYFCPSTDGPQSDNFQEGSPEFFRAMIRRGTGHLFRKILDRGPQIYRIPDLPGTVWSKLTSISDKYGARLWLTGSSICKNIDPLDLDVILAFSDFSHVPSDLIERLNRDFSQIETYKMDWGYALANTAPLFPVIDVESKTLLGSIWFIPDDSSVEGVSVNISEHPLDSIMPDLIEQSQGCSGCSKSSLKVQ